MLNWKELKEKNLKVMEVTDKVRSSKQTLNVKQLRMMYENKEISFDNAMQRGKVWDNEKSSLLIHSIMKNVPIYPVAGIKDEDKILDILDGKQRLLKAVIEFTTGEYKLKNIPIVNVRLDNGEYEEADFNGAYFADLPEYLRDVIDACSFDVILLDEDTPDEDISDMFFRWNNGKPLTAVELTRVKAKSQAEIMEIGKHEIFTSTMTEKALASYKNEDIVMKTWFMLNEEEPDLETKHIRKEVVNIDITEEDRKQIISIYDRILAMRMKIEEILLSKNVKPKSAAAAAKKVLSKTHMISIVPFIASTINENLSVEASSDWFLNFFGEKASGSTSATYNEYARGGSAKKASVAKRHETLEQNYKAWRKRYQEEHKQLEEKIEKNEPSENNAESAISIEERINIAKSSIEELKAEMYAAVIEDESSENEDDVVKSEEHKENTVNEEEINNDEKKIA